MADGSIRELTLRGDEHFSFYADDNGQAYRLTLGEQLLPMTKQEVAETWTARRQARLGNEAKRMAARSRSLHRAGKPNGATIGKHRGLVILVEFKDVKLATPNAQEAFDRYFNEQGYNENGNTGSVRDYFLKQSYGQLEIDFDVVGPYACNGSLEYYGGNDDKGLDKDPTQMVMEAIDAASKEIDFTPYDWDNDGEVDQIFLICAGYDEAEGADSKYIWPHEWTLAAQGIERNYNGKKLNVYGVSTELWGTEKSNPDKTMAGIGTACHEFSHCLGLPDMYDTRGNNFGMGSWDVMCHGSYNNDSHTPAGYTSYERWFSGWLEPTELKEMTRINDMKPIATDKECYVLYNDAQPDEYYMLENRQSVDFDAALPNHGLLVLHVDYSAGEWKNNIVNATEGRERMTIIPADGKASLYNMQGDTYPGTTGKKSLTNYTNPAATLYSENTDGRKLLSKPIDNIVESDAGLISFVACRPELGIPEPDGGTEIEGEAAFTISWPAVTGAISYEVQVTETGTAATDPQEALEREYTFEEFVTKSAGLSDIGDKLGNYGLSGWTGTKIFTSPNKMRIGTSKAGGSLRTATWDVPQSSEVTIVLGTNVVKAGDHVKGTLQVAYGNSGESATKESKEFEVTEDGKLIFHFTIRKDLFWIDIATETQMYLNYLAVYDGTWTAEQLGITNAAARQLSPRKASTTTTYPTDTNSITLKDLNKTSRFVYKVRSLGEEDTSSLWSDEREFKFSNTDGIVDMISVPKDNVIYDLQGHRRDSNPAHLPKGIYIIDGKKVVK